MKSKYPWLLLSISAIAWFIHCPQLDTMRCEVHELYDPSFKETIWPPDMACLLCDNYGDLHDDVIQLKHFPRYWPFVRGIHRSPVNSPHKGQWRRALMASLICAWINGLVNNREAGDLRRHVAHYDVTVMLTGTRSYSSHRNLGNAYII